MTAIRLKENEPFGVSGPVTARRLPTRSTSAAIQIYYKEIRDDPERTHQ